jgi:N-methylhydantoinase B/oxoprolinase/acetone carboxylase alpha subunit
MDVMPEGRVVLDFDGAGEWGWHPFNFTPNAAWGGLSVSVAQTLSYDGRGNHGSLLPFDIKPPAKDSILNPSQIKKLATSTPWAPALDIFGMWQHLLGSAYYLRGFREETFNWRSSSGWQMAGYDQLGNKRPLMWFGTGNFGPGATGVCDGVDCGGFLATAEADMGNEEVWELFVPQLAMGRRFDPYSQGYGRFRSGLSIPAIFMLHRTTQTVASGSIGSGSHRIIPNLGQFGGYPGGKRNTVLIRFDKWREMIAERKPLLHELGHPAELGRRVEEAGGTMTEYGLIPPYVEVYDGDFVCTFTASGGGLGDPIERKTALITADMDNGLTTDWQARNIYCVDASYDETAKGWRVNETATDELRRAKRRERLERAVPVKDWWRKSRQRLMENDLDAQLLEMYGSSAKLSPSFAREF